MRIRDLFREQEVRPQQIHEPPNPGTRYAPGGALPDHVEEDDDDELQKRISIADITNFQAPPSPPSPARQPPLIGPLPKGA